MITKDTQEKLEIFHRDFNLESKHNVDELPSLAAVFGIFATIDGDPINCRYVGESENLEKSIVSLFENSESIGIQRFMQGPWVQMLVYEVLEGSGIEERNQLVKEWTQKYNPKVDEEGEYPGYY